MITRGWVNRRRAFYAGWFSLIQILVLVTLTHCSENIVPEGTSAASDTTAATAATIPPAATSRANHLPATATRTPAAAEAATVTAKATVALQAVTTATPAAPTVTSTPAPTPVASPGAPGAATNLRAETACSDTEPRQGLVTFNWTVASPPGEAQRVDVTIRGFDPGNFISSDPLPVDTNTLVWDRLSGQAIHSWRVLTLREEGWVPGEIARFEGPTCVADFQP